MKSVGGVWPHTVTYVVINDADLQLNNCYFTVITADFAKYYLSAQQKGLSFYSLAENFFDVKLQ